MSDLIDRQAAIDAVRIVIGDNRSISVCDAIKQLQPIQPEITHEQAVEYLQSTGWMREHDLQMMLDGVHRLTVQPEIVRCKDCKYWDTTWQNDYAPNYHYCPMIDGTHRNDFYCADAERREATT